MYEEIQRKMLEHGGLQEDGDCGGGGSRTLPRLGPRRTDGLKVIYSPHINISFPL